MQGFPWHHLCWVATELFVFEQYLISNLTLSPGKFLLLLRQGTQGLLKQLMENVYCLHKNNSSFFLWNFKQEEFIMTPKTVLRAQTGSLGNLCFIQLCIWASYFLSKRSSTEHTWKQKLCYQTPLIWKFEDTMLNNKKLRALKHLSCI